MRQVCRPDSVRPGEPGLAIIPLDDALLRHSSHLPACWDGPPLGPKPAHAYLMLLRIEVTAFHPAAAQPASWLHSTEIAVLVHTCACPCGRLVSVALFLGLPYARHRFRRTAVSRYPALWSPDLPRYPKVPRLPNLPHPCIVTCDNRGFIDLCIRYTLPWPLPR